MSAGPVPDLGVPFDGAHVSAIDVAVNLLWCVPNKVGGSEQYLVRQLLGLASQPAGFVPTIYCLPAFVDAHPELAELFPMVTASITGDDRTRRVLDRAHVARPSDQVGRPRAPRRWHRPADRRRAGRVDDPRPAVRDLPRATSARPSSATCVR